MRAIKLIWTELSFAKRTVSWPQFVAGNARRIAQFAADPRAFVTTWRRLTTRSKAAGLRPLTERGEVPADANLAVDEKTLNWVIPDFSTLSGGHLNIFRFILLLEREGYRSRIYIDGPTQFSSDASARASIRSNFVPVDAQVTLGAESMAPAMYTMATTWKTAYVVRGFGRTRVKCYFVQDFEPFFYPRGSEYVLAENTYRFGFVGITQGEWLSTLLGAEYGMRTFPLRFSYDKEAYSEEVILPKRHVRPRVFFYARPPTPRRAFDIGILVLAEVAKRHPEVEIVTAGWDLNGYSIPFPYENRGALPHSDLPDLFRSCDIGLVLSCSNVSLLPLELMACGCAVVSNKGANVEWLLDETVAVLADFDVDAIAEAICDLVENPEARLRIQKASLEFSGATDWEREGRKLGGFLRQLAEEST